MTDVLRQLEERYKQAAAAPPSSMLFSPCPGYTLSYPGNNSSSDLTLGGAILSERGRAARYREKFMLRPDDNNRLNNIVHAKDDNRVSDAEWNRVPWEDIRENATVKHDWVGTGMYGGATDRERGIAAEAREKFHFPKSNKALWSIYEDLSEKIVHDKDSRPVSRQDWNSIPWNTVYNLQWANKWHGRRDRHHHSRF